MPNNKKLIDLAYDMASYAHHAGYPNYDGGHSEPEINCEHTDCKTVRLAKLEQQLTIPELAQIYDFVGRQALPYDNEELHLAVKKLGLIVESNELDK